MSYFLYRLNPPRTTFMRDMTAEESQLMREHSAYWRTLMEAGVAIVFGPVANPTDPHGICVLQAKDQRHVEMLGADDPAIKANRGFSFNVYLMPAVIYLHQVS